MGCSWKTVLGHKVHLLKVMLIHICNTVSTQTVWLHVCGLLSTCVNVITLTGFKFWKVGSRKTFAVRQGNLKMKSSHKRGPVVISDSDSDGDLMSQTICKPPPYLTPLVEEVKEMRKGHSMPLSNNREDQSFPWSLPTTEGNIPVSYLSFHSHSTTCYFC